MIRDEPYPRTRLRSEKKGEKRGKGRCSPCYFYKLFIETQLPLYQALISASGRYQTSPAISANLQFGYGHLTIFDLAGHAPLAGIFLHSQMTSIPLPNCPTNQTMWEDVPGERRKGSSTRNISRSTVMPFSEDELWDMFMRSSPDGVPGPLTPDASSMASDNPSPPARIPARTEELNSFPRIIQDAILQDFGDAISPNDLDHTGLMSPATTSATDPTDYSIDGSPLFCPGHPGYASIR